jgi:F-type H+-transporting ATPase subunit gamma
VTVEQERRRSAVRAVHDVVSAMRAMAAGRMQGTQRAHQSARQYHDRVKAGLALALGNTRRGSPPLEPTYPIALVVLTSEQAFCGRFNHDILDAARERWHELSLNGPVQLIVVGKRGARQMPALGMTPVAELAGATSVPGLRSVVNGMAELIGHRIASGSIQGVDVVYSQYHSVSEQTPEVERILPLDFVDLPEAAAPRFTRYLPSPELLAGLVREYAFIMLYRLAAESYASEQASRLVAMDAATRSTERMIEQLQSMERRERHARVTQETLEAVASRLALRLGEE